MELQKCTFCQSEGELHEAEAPIIRLCTPCREKLCTHLAVVCIGCNTLHWLPKTPQNIEAASRMSDLPPQHLVDNYIVHEIKTCKNCYRATSDYIVTQKWTQ